MEKKYTKDELNKLEDSLSKEGISNDEILDLMDKYIGDVTTSKKVLSIFRKYVSKDKLYELLQEQELIYKKLIGKN